MLKGAQHDNGEVVMEIKQIVCVRATVKETKGFKKVHSGAGDPGSSPG
jgi:hypothetical protein